MFTHTHAIINMEVTNINCLDQGLVGESTTTLRQHLSAKPIMNGGA